MSSNIKLQMRPGEIFDRLSILILKQRFGKQDTIALQEEILLLFSEILENNLFKRLLAINCSLWLLENTVRNNDFDFEICAKAIFAMNEIRSEIKTEVDSFYGYTNADTKAYSPIGENRT